LRRQQAYARRALRRKNVEPRTTVRRTASSGPQNRRLAAACAAEATLLLAALATSIGHSAEHPNASGRLFTMIVLTALAMGLRNAVVRSLGVPDVTTTVLTMNGHRPGH
jgi:uncharacterized membrane protein YoaK (UPF0700 family)